MTSDSHLDQFIKFWVINVIKMVRAVIDSIYLWAIIMKIWVSPETEPEPQSVPVPVPVSEQRRSGMFYWMHCGLPGPPWPKGIAVRAQFLSQLSTLLSIRFILGLNEIKSFPYGRGNPRIDSTVLITTRSQRRNDSKVIRLWIEMFINCTEVLNNYILLLLSFYYLLLTNESLSDPNQHLRLT